MSEAKERPILFSAPMVRAILAGRKTQTRRVMKHQPAECVEALAFLHGEWHFKIPGLPLTAYDSSVKCPLGKPGDQLWVRENTVADDDSNDTVTLAKYVADGEHVLYPGEPFDADGEPSFGGSCAHWWYSRDACPSIHMPRKFSRISLSISDVRAERLQSISDLDALAEGIQFDQGWEQCPGFGYLDYSKPDEQSFSFTSPRDSFKSLWDSINSKKHPWKSNPWVWVTEFEAVKPNQ